MLTLEDLKKDINIKKTMKTNELRLGNYVIYNENIVCVDKIYGENIGYNLLNENYIGIAYIKSISSIILTDELLLKLGAKKDVDFKGKLARNPTSL